MSARTLAVTELARRCDAAALNTEAAPEALVVGQDRARAAIGYAIAEARPGHHLFVMGAPGSGKRSLVRQAIAAADARAGTRSDWVYVNNFERTHQPLALKLPPGDGARLRQHMRALVDELCTMIPATFQSEEYAEAVERLAMELKERAERALREVSEAALAQGLLMVRTPVGFSFAPRKSGGDGDEVLSGEEFEALPEAERLRLQQAVVQAQEQLLRALRQSLRARKEHADRLRELKRSMAQVAISHAVDEARAHHADQSAVLAYLDAVRADVLAKVDRFPTGDEDGKRVLTPEDFPEYEVNLLVDSGADGPVPVVELDHPTHAHLVGRIDHLAHQGMLLTDFRFIKPGALHRAGGGYLLIDALALLTQPMSWDALKRALTRGEVRIESLAEAFSLISTVTLDPTPIELDVKVILFGEREIGWLLRALDPDFDRLFGVIADLSDEIPRSDATQRELAAALAAQARAQGLLPLEPQAVARLIDDAARHAGDAARLSADRRRLHALLVESNHLARRAGRSTIASEQVSAALSARRQRSSRIQQQLAEEVARERLMIATAGTRVGQVNGLMVYEIGGETFGEVARITATSRLGEGEVIDVQRETHLGGPLHAKGVLILSSFLAARYARFQPHAIVASLVFEQTYGYVEGDSASLGELAALLSSIGDVPVRQCLAITGSVNQFGDAQAIGGVNEKIEGFFDLCAARGLDGSHGVIVPQSNVSQLMLRDDVVEAVAAGRFALHAVRHIDEAIEVLTGWPVGDPLTADRNTVNGRIVARLREYARLGRGERRFPRRRRTHTMHAEGDGAGAGGRR